MNIARAVVGKTIAGAVFLKCDLVSLLFTDGTVLYIKQPSQTGDLFLTLTKEGKDGTIVADDEDKDCF